MQVDMEEINLQDSNCDTQESETRAISNVSYCEDIIGHESSFLEFGQSLDSSKSHTINGKNCMTNNLNETLADNEVILDYIINEEGLIDISQLLSKSKDEIIQFIEIQIQQKIFTFLQENRRHKEDMEKVILQESLFTSQIECLEKDIAQSKADAFAWENELIQVKEKLNQEKLSIQSDLMSRLDIALKQFESANRDKEEMVMKYAKAEKEVLVVKKQKEQLEKKVKDLEKDKDLLKNKVQNLTAEKSRLSVVIDQKIQEHGITLRNMDKLREEITTKDSKIKWNQAKLQQEVDAHKESQLKLDRALSKICGHDREIKSTKEEAEKVIKEVSEGDSSKAAQLEKQLQETKAKLILETQRISEMAPLYEQLKADHENLTAIHLLLQSENTTLKAKVSTYQQEREESEKLFESLQLEVKNVKLQNNELHQKLTQLSAVESELQSEKRIIDLEKLRCEELQDKLNDLSSELAGSRQKESELLIFTKKLTDEDVLLRSQLMEAQEKARMLESEQNEKASNNQELEIQLCKSTKDVQKLQKNKEVEEERLNSVIEGLNLETNTLRTKISDLENELIVQQKRHGKSLKDANREVLKLRKKLDGCECVNLKQHPIASQAVVSPSSFSNIDDEKVVEEGSLGRTRGEMSIEGKMISSTNCDQTESWQQHSIAYRMLPQAGWTPPDALSQNSRASSNVSLNAESSNGPSSLLEMENPSLLSEIPKQALVNRIAKLQGDLLKKREKIDFLEEHIGQLLHELKNKNKIICHYILKEDGGALVGSKSDDAKAEILKHGGIMASVYSSTSKDSTMTLELSLEINRKLQAVLEDTLLKNITLKENLNTLGDEVAKLALQNSQYRKN